MKNFKMGLVVAILTIGAAMLIVIQYEAQIKLRAENESLRQQLAQLKADNESLSNRLATAGNSHSLADDQLNELLKLRGEATRLRADVEFAPTESAMKAWAVKVTLLKQKLEQMPDKKIPELQFATEKDWADAAWNADLNTEDGVRQALSKLREEAKNTFLNDMMKAAIKKYIAANDGMLPANLFQLKPYFDAPVTDAMLQHYELLQTGKPSSDTSEPLVKEIAPPVDDEYDSYHAISMSGAGGSGVNRVQSAIFTAANAFAKDNNGQKPSEPSQIASYLKQSINTATVQKYLNKMAADAALPNQ